MPPSVSVGAKPTLAPHFSPLNPPNSVCISHLVDKLWITHVKYFLVICMNANVDNSVDNLWIRGGGSPTWHVFWVAAITYKRGKSHLEQNQGLFRTKIPTFWLKYAILRYPVPEFSKLVKKRPKLASETVTQD